MANLDNGDKKFFDDRGFGQRIGFGARPALLIVDYVNAFTDASQPLGSNLDAELVQTNWLIDAAHAKDAPVLFSTVYYDEPDLRDAGIWGLKQKGIVSLKAGTPGVEIDSRLHREPRDPVFTKKYASCFFSSDLASRLQFRGIDTLIITGCTTSGCVRATAVDACQLGFRPIIAREAVGDRSKAAHEQSLFDLNAKYADVCGVDEILQYLHALKSGAPAVKAA